MRYVALYRDEFANFIVTLRTFRATIYADFRKLLAATPMFTGLVERATERMRGASLHGQKVLASRLSERLPRHAKVGS